MLTTILAGVCIGVAVNLVSSHLQFKKVNSKLAEHTDLLKARDPSDELSN